jgi:hypothetical protein
MELFRTLLLNESEKTAKKEALFAIHAINDIYKEWKKTKRRVNAVDIVTTSINKITKIHPSTLPYLHDTAKLKLSIILMRVMDLPHTKNVDTKKSVYKKIFPLLSALQAYNPNTGTGGNLREVVMTRLSCSITHENDKENKVFVAYEPSVTTAYLTYLFGEKTPDKVFKMQTLSLPEEYDTLINVLTINYNKAASKVDKQRGVKV